MSYYMYMQSVYNSCLPQLNRSLRSSSVERHTPPRTYYTSSSVDNSSRYMRAATVGPTDFLYTSAMPFSYEAEKAIERLMNRRAASVEPVLKRPFTYTQAYQTGGHGYSAFDYKVMDYAARLDSEETTRRYINERKDYMSTRSYEPASYRSRYDYYSAMKHENDFLYDRSSVCRDFICTRKSKATLEARNQRAKSPLQSRELDRYYKTERRASFVGDISSGGSRDFRFYNYRAVPYFGGSDYYTLTKKRLRR